MSAERNPAKEIIQRGDLYYLWHPGNNDTFSGYGLTIEKGNKSWLVGLLMVDRPNPVETDWLEQVGKIYGGYQLTPITATGEQGIACQMLIQPDSQKHLKRLSSIQSKEIQAALQPLLDYQPHPAFILQWDNDNQVWRSEFAPTDQLPEELRMVFQTTGYGCAAVESNIGIVHACHAADRDIAGFRDQPVEPQWQLIRMPTASLIRLELVIYDQPASPYRFESFLNVADPEQLRILARLASQEKLYLSFYGDELTYDYSTIITHSEQQWQRLDEMVDEAIAHQQTIRPELQDFNRAKQLFCRQTALE